MNFFQWSASLSCVQQYTTSFHISTACENQEWTNLTTSWWEQPLTYTRPSSQPPAGPRPCAATAQLHWSPHTHTRSVSSCSSWMKPKITSDQEVIVYTWHINFYNFCIKYKNLTHKRMLCTSMICVFCRKATRWILIKFDNVGLC
jgi:hypothetical protein